MGKASIRRRGKILGEGENDGDFFKLLTTHDSLLTEFLGLTFIPMVIVIEKQNEFSFC